MVVVRSAVVFVGAMVESDAMRARTEALASARGASAAAADAWAGVRSRGSDAEGDKEGRDQHTVQAAQQQVRSKQDTHHDTSTTSTVTSARKDGPAGGLGGVGDGPGGQRRR